MTYLAQNIIDQYLGTYIYVWYFLSLAKKKSIFRTFEKLLELYICLFTLVDDIIFFFCKKTSLTPFISYHPCSHIECFDS